MLRKLKWVLVGKSTPGFAEGVRLSPAAAEARYSLRANQSDRRVARGAKNMTEFEPTFRFVTSHPTLVVVTEAGCVWEWEPSLEERQALTPTFPFLGNPADMDDGVTRTKDI